ncbi:ABC transporter substrate-binding protein [Rathayibacter sp. Leaf248]|uniref:ABC transporter substrate-binding protein n=1 Tax=Rathayibacter sp. Leaf248 TaxID=2876555 RepID=UPI001E4D2200|nr:ABC transporter substrate-binding protein [Rathayibacter sp. Leaf248]
MRRSIPSLAAAAAAALLLAGCSASTPADDSGSGGDAPEPTMSASLQLHWAWSASTAGFALAETDGLYEDAGLDLQVEQGTGSGTAVQLVSSGQADVGVADATAIAQAVAQGAPLVVVSTINQVTNTALQALTDEGIESVEDLRGKTVAVPQGGAFSFLFPLFLEQNGLSEDDVTIANVPFESMVPSLLQGNVDAIVGGQDSNVSLTNLDADFDEFLFGDYGVTLVAHSIFTTQSFLDEQPDTVRAVVAASLDGWGEALDDPQRALDAIQELQPDSVEENARAELEFLLPLLCAAEATHVGEAAPERWTTSNELMVRAGLLDAPLDPATYTSYDYLPAEDDLRSCE